MATYTVTTAAHKTLTANTVDTVTLSGNFAEIEVLNRSSAEIYFTTDGTTPTVAGDNMRVVPAGGALKRGRGTGVVKLISSAAAAYSVSGA